MFKKKLFWYLFPSYLLIILFLLLFTSLNTSYDFKKFYFKEVEDNQKTLISLYKDNFENYLYKNNMQKLNELVKNIDEKASVRVTIINTSGQVINDSREDISLMENHKNRPEVIKALNGKTSSTIRFSNTLNQYMIYVASPLYNSGKIEGVIRTSVAIKLLQHNLNILYKKLLEAGLITSLIAIFIGYLFSKRIQKPLLELQESALKFAEGDFLTPVPIHPIKEMGALAESMNIMVAKLKQLENIRKDFVANVSHELKTPITSIKGFIETLQEGAIENKEEALHFLDIILRHTNRLNAIIEDLLMLSRLEQIPNNNEIILEKTLLNPVLKTAIQVCEMQAQNKSIKINFECSPYIYAWIDELLFEQAIVNLIDNAIKYSSENKEITIFSEVTDKDVLIRIIDQGSGISSEHISRIFERFYRVDKARSRKAGGTGLGLSIVKHIINTHKGIIEVESELNKGSVFTIHLPKDLSIN